MSAEPGSVPTSTLSVVAHLFNRGIQSTELGGSKELWLAVLKLTERDLVQLAPFSKSRSATAEACQEPKTCVPNMFADPILSARYITWMEGERLHAISVSERQNQLQQKPSPAKVVTCEVVEEVEYEAYGIGDMTTNPQHLFLLSAPYGGMANERQRTTHSHTNVILKKK